MRVLFWADRRAFDEDAWKSRKWGKNKSHIIQFLDWYGFFEIGFEQRSVFLRDQTKLLFCVNFKQIDCFSLHLSGKLCRARMCIFTRLNRVSLLKSSVLFWLAPLLELIELLGWVTPPRFGIAAFTRFYELPLRKIRSCFCVTASVRRFLELLSELLT